MKYKFVEQIEIENGKVYLKAYSNSNASTTAGKDACRGLYEADTLSEILQAEGEHAVWKALGGNIFEDKIIMRPYNCRLAEYFKQAGDMLKAPLKYSLDTDRAGDFIATVVEGYLNDALYSPIPELTKLKALRSDPEQVFSICKNNPTAFHFSDVNVRRNRALAQKYIQEYIFADGFSFPSYFQDDTDMVMEALQKNASIFKQLSVQLRNNKDVVRMAYSPKTNRTEQDFFASYIGKNLLSDPTFMRELVEKCPDLRIDNCIEILFLPDVAEAWILHNNFVKKELIHIPLEILLKPSVYLALAKRLADDKSSMGIVDKLIANGIHASRRSEPLCAAANLPSRRSAKTVNTQK